jgi:gamma-glutamylputrescine oxidase
MNATDSTVYGNTLYAATIDAPPSFPRLAFDLDLDVCVIGGGLAGLTAAREIARRGWSVALIEARRIAWNASGRNAGFVLPGFAQSVEQMIARVGRDRARRLWALSQEGLDYVRATIAETCMPRVAPVPGWLDVSKVDRHDEIAAHAALLRDTLGADVEFWPTELVRQHLKTDRYFQATHFPGAFHIDPLHYALGLAAAAADAGVKIFEETPALAIDPAGVRKRVVTPDGRIRASHIVLAGNVHLGALFARVSGTLTPITTYVIATAPLGERLAEAMNYRGAVSDSDWADNHYRPTEDNRLIFSGRMTTWRGNPQRYGQALHRDLQRLYPQLGEVTIERAWRGTLGVTVHRMPQIGELSSGLWLASGFGGHGLNTTALAGNLIAAAIVEGDDRWRLLTPYELVWSGGVLGRAAVQAGYWAYRVQQRFLEDRSRRREQRRLRREAQVAEREAQQALAAIPSPGEQATEVTAAAQSAEPAGKPMRGDSRKSRKRRKRSGKLEGGLASSESSGAG